ncbi:extracellular solute-binding protein, partial [uncultured Victivallis sp.]|uniref:extracellular solute-binding protein n=1 Tax=uncultured Victivallis sp. TaxID=354118 RepID=UPI0025E0C208
MADKLQSAREYILRRIDAGEFRGGEKLPSARELAERTGISFPIVQMAFNTLIADGILSSGVSRQGTCIRKDWAERILPGSFLSFRPVWNELFSQKIRPQIPELLAVDHFQAGACEIRVTYDAVSLQKEYLDLSEFLEEEYPDRSDFFNARIEQFRSHDGKLYALPLMFSPWVFCCDETLFQAAGCKMPGPDWTWEEFLDLLRELQGKLPANQILASYKDPTRWLIYLTHFGGKIFEQQQDRTFQCRLNSPETLDALNRLQELYHLLPRSEQRNTVCALRLCTRQDIASYQLQGSYLPLPRVPGDRKAGSLMAGDLLCIRKTVNNFQLVRELIREFLSPELQQEIGNRKYGI